MQTVSNDFKTAEIQPVRQPIDKCLIRWAPVDIFDDPTDHVYIDETDYLLGYSIERTVKEPIGGIAYALGDITLSNCDKRFTPSYDPLIGDYILPRRPIWLKMGLVTDGGDEYVNSLIGLISQIKEDKSNRVVRISCYDYLSFIDQYQLESTVYADQRTDEIIEDILTTIGFDSDQYELDEGLNTIGFTWFDKGSRAGDVIRKLCESEEAFFYQDESGVLRFENRRSYRTGARTNVVYTVGVDDILEWKEDDSVSVINRCVVTARPRTVVENQELWTSPEIIKLNVGESKDIWANWADPANVITTPATDSDSDKTDYIANTLSDGTGTDVTSFLDISIDKFTTSAKLTLTNNYGGVLYIVKLRLRGDPAIEFPVAEMYQDEDSQATYGVQELQVENPYIDTDDFAYYLARAVVRKYKDPLRRFSIVIRAIPELQLKDRIQVTDPDTDTSGEYRVMKIKLLSGIEDGALQELTLREITTDESDRPAIVGTSTIGGNDVIWY